MLNNDKLLYQEEENKLLKTILHYRFFDPWDYDYGDKYSLKSDANLELYLTSECNQHCQYCYLTKHADLYPKNCLDHDLILKNLRIMYDWLLQHQYVINKIEFFTGEIWHTQFGWDVLELTLEYLKKGMRVGFFMCASNFSFIFDDDITARIHHYLQQFDDYGSHFVFSCSVDGAVVENMSRPVNNGQVRDEVYWDKLFTFCKVHSFWFHPMISAKNIAHQIENYQWWESMCQKYNFSIKSAVNMLEVRNDDWTEENIKDYCRWMEWLMNKYFEECNNDPVLYATRIMHFRNELVHIDPQTFETGYCPVNIGEVDTFMGCTICTDLTVRIGDLAICPCHRTAYNKYLYGKFVVENDKIVDIQAINANMAARILMGNFNICNLSCDTCLFNGCCMHGCLGAQIEATGDPFFPAVTVCNFFKAKFAYILKWYEEHQIIDFLKTITPYERDYLNAQHILMIYHNWVKEGKPYVVSI